HVDYKTTLDIDAQPEGDELMRVDALSQPGTRTFTVDKDGLISSEQYQKYPTPYILGQFSTTKKVVALTFDDGPDPRYTPKILQILQQNDVRGTFFIIGQAAAQYPEIVRRCWANGNDLGNHTYTHPHIALVSPLRAELELNATQMVIEGITGHMSLLFRPPYGDSPDASTVGAEDIPILLEMEHNHFVTVGMNIDPKDYLKPTPEEIVARIDRQVRSPKNHVILLHDGGGDRRNTVAALPLIIQDLKARGYQFVTISEMMGSGGHAMLFPAVTRQQGEIAGLDRLIFELGYGLQYLLRVLFLAAIALGIMRLLAFAVLAIKHHRRTRASAVDADYAPSVTVAIPAYNEEAVICRTIESVLASDYPDLRVIVVDDGSRDDTAVEAETCFAHDPRVMVIRKANGGKASALNIAFAQAETEIVVCMDADTIFTPTTVRRLVQDFADPRVGAVAGNVKVGNRINPLALWQSVEYITSQNFDRRAYAALNSVAVVPGAAGAWRRAVVLDAGGFESNTLAEDTDLTFKIRLRGYQTRCNNDALAYTEAPDSLPTLAKQRFRWSFGILQALWKHRRKVFHPRYGAFGMVVMPTMWIFNILLQVLAPAVDLTVLLALISGQFLTVFFYMAAFFILDAVAALIAFRIDREDPKPLAWLFLQRLFYREFLYYIILKAILAALRGGLVGWGKLERKATVSLPHG
ncbi:MAG TPA: glycosyltransferase, partial [Armatimonadota bacterium]